MQTFFDSPRTIRNKHKEFKTTFGGGFNKQDVMNYLSVLGEQQGVMIKLLRDNNISLNVDDGYDVEEQFSQPNHDTQDLVDKYSNGDNSMVIAELQAEIEALRVENEQLKVTSLSNETISNESSDFDAEYNLAPYRQSDTQEDVSNLKLEIAQKDMYISELEAQITNEQPMEFNSEVAVVDDSVINEYKEKIATLEQQLEDARATTASTSDDSFDALFDETDNTSDTSEHLLKLQSEYDDLKELYEIALMELEDSKSNNVLESNETPVSDDAEPVLDLGEYLNSTDETDTIATSNEEMDFEEHIANLTANVEILELEISNIEKEKRSLETKLEESESKLAKFTNVELNGEVVEVLDPETLAMKNREVLEIQESILSEKQQIDDKLKEISLKEELIEANKHLLSDDYVNSVTAKEKEVDMLRKQMDKMLLVAQATAEETEKEATDKAASILEKASQESQDVIERAMAHKEMLESQANAILEEANENKTVTEAELLKFRENTREEAENMVLEARDKAEEVLKEAQDEAVRINMLATDEVTNIMAQAEEKVAVIDRAIADKQKVLEETHRHYLKVKKDSLTALKRLQSNIENIIYGDEGL